MPHSTPSTDGQNTVFGTLKPYCVALSEQALAINGPRCDTGAVTLKLRDLLKVLTHLTDKPATLDAKLADYVFFPLSNVLKASAKLPTEALELSVRCLAILIEHGWRHHIQPPLAAQIIILGSLLAEQHPKGLLTDRSSNELRTAALYCLACLFRVMGAEAKKAVVADSNFPQLGHTVSVMLDALVDTGSTEMLLAAVGAFDAFLKQVSNPDIDATFLPGTISKLTRVLCPTTKGRVNHRVIAETLDVFTFLLRSTLGRKPSDSDTAKTTRTHSWRASAATQLKPFLKRVMRLVEHGKSDVREALAHLCLTLLDECRDALQESTMLALESLLTLAASDDVGSPSIDEIASLARGSSEVAELIQTSLYGWLQTFAIVMHSQDQALRDARIRKIEIAYQTLVLADQQTDMLGNALARGLVAGVSTIISDPLSHEVGRPSKIITTDLVGKLAYHHQPTFQSSVTRHKVQETTLGNVARIIAAVASTANGIVFCDEVLKELTISNGDELIAAHWTLLTCIEKSLLNQSQFTELLSISDMDSVMTLACLDDIYALALETLTSDAFGETDDRLVSLSLQTLSLKAKTTGKDFRFELIDALYPTLHLLASPNEDVQAVSIATLDHFAEACGFASTKDLIVQNVDYLTNAVALKLNSFDVSPQAPQVLLMMVRLAGPSLLPLLGDTIESIFAALEDYHGYELLVEMLFRVLGVIAEEGAKAPVLAIGSGKPETHASFLLDRPKPRSVEDAIQSLTALAEDEPVSATGPRPHLQEPWGKDSTVEDFSMPDEEGDESQDLDEARPPPPEPQTYQLLLRISELTQHYLPSSSPALRTSLLGLIRTTIPAISKHEDSFLPLINTLWPEIIGRIDDDEPQIVSAALEIVQLLCEYAGNFMRSRIFQLWPRLIELFQHTADKLFAPLAMRQNDQSGSNQNQTKTTSLSPLPSKQLVARLAAQSGDYLDTMGLMLWNALVATMKAIVTFVPTTPDLFDEALSMLSAALDDIDIRGALEQRNADAVWLMRLRQDALARPRQPSSADAALWDFAVLPKS